LVFPDELGLNGVQWVFYNEDGGQFHHLSSEFTIHAKP